MSTIAGLEYWHTAAAFAWVCVFSGNVRNYFVLFVSLSILL